MTATSSDDTRWSCPACGHACGADDGFCGSCGTSRTGTPPGRWQVVVESCRIERWRGYVKSTFYAVTSDGMVLAESPSFRWRRRQPPPDGGAARKAFDQLVKTLAEDGWTRVELGGRTWYGVSLSRDVHVQQPAPATAARRANHAAEPSQQSGTASPLGSSHGSPIATLNSPSVRRVAKARGNGSCPDG